MGQIILLLVLILINAFFAATEIAFISINDIKVEHEARKGSKKAKDILELLKSPSAFLATIQIGITLAGFLSSAFASEAFAEKLAPILNDLIPDISLGTWNTITIILITFILSFFMLIFGELIPKRIALKHDEKIAYSTVGIVSFIAFITKPFVIFLTIITNKVSKLFGVKEFEEEKITEEEIRLIISEGQEKGAIKKYEKNLINNVLEFNDTFIKDILIKKENVFSLDVNISFEEALKKLKKENFKYSRVPLYDKSIDNIVGVIYIKDIFKNLSKKGVTLKQIMYEPKFISSNEYVNVAFNKMKRNKNHLTFVKDKKDYVGIILMKDVIEEIVGNIDDEYDRN